LIVGVVFVALCGAGAYYVYQNLQAIGAKVAREAAVAVIEDLDLSDEEKRKIIAQIDRVVDEYEAGRITLEEVGSVLEELAESPLTSLIVVYAAMENYVGPSGLSDEEKTDAKRTFQRIARGFAENKISQDDIETALDYVSTTTETGERQFSESVTDEQLRAMLDECNRVADEAGIPDEDFEIDVAQEFKRAVDRALGVDTPDEPVAPADDAAPEDAVKPQAGESS